MSYRQALDEAIGHSPVSTIDVDHIISRQRRARKLRLWGGGGAGAAAVLAVTLTANLLWGPHTSAVPPGVDPGVTMAGTEADWQRVDAVVVASLRRVAPWITWPDSTTPHDRPEWTTNQSSRDTVEGFSVQGNIAVGAAQGTLAVQVTRNARHQFEQSPCTREQVAAEECRESTGSNGRQVRIAEVPHATGAPERDYWQTRMVTVLRPNGTAVILHLRNTLSQGPPPLTVEQMTAVASDPAVELGPLPPGREAPSGPAIWPSAPEDPAQKERLDKAVLAALRAQVPGITGGHSVELEKVWSESRGENTIDSYSGGAKITKGSARPALFSVNIRRIGPGGGLTCGKPSKAVSCRHGEGPKGERYRITTDITEKDSTRAGKRTIVVLREDGSRLEVNQTSGGIGPAFALTEKQQLAIALSPNLAFTAD
ncbi:hypothetical protein ACIBJE_09955 [Micromonospora sp. NPDC050187]|uniref:hypothetical protein n=1 Tax=Micromonospora sp. NPDC050187 TaxID=3364277 RepID=UPI0037AC82FF